MTGIQPFTYFQTKRFFLITSIASVLSIFILLLIPSEGRNVFIFSISKARVALMLPNLFIAISSIAIYANLHIENSIGRRIFKISQSWSQNTIYIHWTRVIAMISFGIGSFLLIATFITGDQYIKGIMLRLAPLIGLGTLIFALINITCIRIYAKPSSSELYRQQIFIVSLVWIFLNLFWLLATTQYLNEYLIFKVVVIFVSVVFFWIIFALEHQYDLHSIPQWVIGVTILLEVVVSIWLSSQLQYFAISQFLILLFIFACTGQILFLLASLFYKPQSKIISFSRFQINIPTIITSLNWFATMLVVLGISTQVLNVSPNICFSPNLFHLDSEKNIPAYFSTGILLLSAGLLLLIFYNQRKKHAKFSFHWFLLGLIFLFLSLDELMSIHESLIGPVRQNFEGQGVFSYEWILIAIPIVIILAIAYFRFLLTLPPTTRNLFILAGIIYIGGSLGGEMLSGWYASNFSEADSNYLMLTILEETLEMAGIIIFISALLLVVYFENIRDETAVIDSTQIFEP